MKKVAKLIIKDKDDKYLILRLNNHPTLGNTHDLPGGTADEGETAVEAMIREVEEEIGFRVTPNDVQELYSGTNYSPNGTLYALFTTKLDKRPDITLSWEHSAYDWLEKEEFLNSAAETRNTFIRMAYDKLK